MSEEYDRLKTQALELIAEGYLPRELSESQSLDLAYANLACSTNHKPSRKAFVSLAQTHYGWSPEDAEAWALARKWERE